MVEAFGTAQPRPGQSLVRRLTLFYGRMLVLKAVRVSHSISAMTASQPLFQESDHLDSCGESALCRERQGIASKDRSRSCRHA